MCQIDLRMPEKAKTRQDGGERYRKTAKRIPRLTNGSCILMDTYLPKERIYIYVPKSHSWCTDDGDGDLENATD
jgi:hypothetical protein